MLKRISRWLGIKARLIRKSIIINHCNNSQGGKLKRCVRRRLRVEAIKEQKEFMRMDLITGWELGEIPRPTDFEKSQFFLYYHYLTWSYILETKMKYRNKN